MDLSIIDDKSELELDKVHLPLTKSIPHIDVYNSTRR